MATLKDISKKTGLSVAQISRALNGYPDVSAKTRERVQEVARQLNYSPNLSARRLVTGRSNHIGLIKRHHDQLAHDMAFLENLVGLTRAFTKQNLQLSFHLAEDNDSILDFYSNLYDSGSNDGFVITEPRRFDERIQFLLERKIPFVVHGRSPENSNYAFVDIDNYAVGYNLTQHLILQGHKRIAMINGVESRDYSVSRLQGYSQALSDYGIPYDPELVHHGHMNPSLGNSATLQLMRFVQSPPSALICGHMLLADGAIRALNSLQLNIPEDVSIVAHDDMLAQFESMQFYPSISVTRSAISDAFQPLADFMARQLGGEEVDTCQKIIPVEFISRNSVKFIN